MQNYILYNASEGIHSTNECRYALLKLLSVYNLKPPPSLFVVVHTGHPRLFDDFLTFFPHIEITGPFNEHSHAKAQIIQKFFLTTHGNLLICDTATYPLKPLETLFGEIEKGILFLYRKELPQTNGHNSVAKQVQSILSQSQHQMDGLPAKVHETPVHNAAIIGLNNSMLHVVKYAGEMINGLFQKIPHPFAVNFAFSHAFQKQPPIKTANDYFADYFELNEFRKLLQTFFRKNEEESIPSLVKLINHLDVGAIKLEKKKHIQLPLLKKWWKELTGKGWSIRKYEKRIS
ncbi:hypothetical protein OCK74_02925 [Chitinophagaceae bacterium LB-8]|uniref:Uncharacterized protein n=1 Tax=Paraflavisolibacter caeni TaxID=2982496 RepID=A0A9X3BGM9_9BACT|nr:hypothetical protein [Paraflavisolibacter caeni]MCU7548047.1 hypothetical protein [Paraflavisolibacter caeni]